MLKVQKMKCLDVFKGHLDGWNIDFYCDLKEGHKGKCHYVIW